MSRLYKQLLREEKMLFEQQIKTLRSQLGTKDGGILLKAASKNHRRIDNILDISHRQGFLKVESLVLFRKHNGDLAMYRRQMGSLVCTLKRDRPKISEFIYWFLSDNCMTDFNDYKNYVLNNCFKIKI